MNTRDKNFSKAKMKRRLQQIDESIVRYLSQLESADRVDPGNTDKVDGLQEKIATLKKEMQRLKSSKPGCLSHRASKSHSLIPMPVPWLPVAAAAGWWATTCRRRWMQSIT